MPNYLSPGVYVEEVEAGSRPIEGVGTAVAAFVGLAGRGPANTPTLVTNWNQFTSTFGEFIEGSYLAHSVYGYFLNGGGAAYVVRVGADGVEPTASAEVPGAEKGKPAFRVAAIQSGTSGNDISVDVEAPGDGSDGNFKLVVKQGGKIVETFDNVSAGKGKTNVATVVKAQSKTIVIEEAGGAVAAPSTGSVSLAGGGAAVPARVTPTDYVGNSSDRTGFAGLEAVDEVTMLSVPDLMAVYEQGIIDLEGLQAVQLAMIAHCELMGDRVAILDAPPGLNAQQV
jgi:phage tail sheath protein FI